MAAAFGGKALTARVGKSGIGAQLCMFILASSNLGGARGVVTISVDGQSSASSFAAAMKLINGAVPVSGLGDTAYYVNNTSTIQFRKSHTAVAVQAQMKLKAGTQFAARIRADVLAVSKQIVSQL